MREFVANLVRSWSSYHAWIIGVVLIGLSSYTRFNIPPTSRSSTTWGRYHTAVVTYVAVMIVGWIVLASTPDLLDPLGVEVKLPPEVTQFAAPLYAALVLTVLVSSLKPFQKADEKLRTFFHDLARIPWEAQRLSARLRATTWLPTLGLQAQVRNALRAVDFNDPDISFSDDGSPQALWTKISALHYHLNRWKSGEQRRFAAFYYQHLTDFDKLSKDYDALAVVARRVFHLLDTLQPMQSDPKLAEVQKELIDEFVDRAERLEKEIDDLISRALLQGALTEKTRWEAQAAMGFVVNMAPDRLFDQLLLLYIILGALYITVLLLAHRPWPKLSGAIIATNYMGAILSAFYLKQYAFACPTEAGRPIRGYVLSGFIALVVGIVTSFSFGVLLTWSVQKSAHLLLERWWPWSIMGAFMAAATAYNIDNDERSGRRWIEAALQAAVGAGGALIVYLQLKGLCTGTSDPDCVVPSPVRVILTAAVAGGLIGALVPTWYREPQTMTVDYKQCKVIVTVKVLPNRPVVPTILIRRHGSDAQASPLPFEEEFLSAEEALARAVVYARRQIDVDSTVDVD